MFGLGNNIRADETLTPSRVTAAPMSLTLSPASSRVDVANVTSPMVTGPRDIILPAKMPNLAAALFAYGHRKIHLRAGKVHKQITITLKVPLPLQAAVSNVVHLVAPTVAKIESGMPRIGFSQHEGLWIVDAPTAAAVSGFGAETRLSTVELPSALLAVMKAMTYTPDAGASSMTERGQANFVLGQLTGNAADTVQQKVSSGYAALVDKASVTTGVLKLVFTKDPSTVAKLAGGDSASHALISEEPSSVIAGALEQINGAVPASVVEPSGATTDAAPAPSEKPKWLVPVLIGAGVIAIGAFVMGGKKARPNRRRHRRA